MAGTYVLQGFTTDSLDTHPPSLVEFPFMSVGVPIDSVHDQIVLQADSTYEETGGVWAAGTIQNLIDVHGTYTLNNAGNTGITLTPDSASHMTVGTGSLLSNTLTFDRYPGIWTFIKK